jgi:hypothetical protein
VTKADAQKVFKIISATKPRPEFIAKWPGSVTRWSGLTKRGIPTNSIGIPSFQLLGRLVIEWEKNGLLTVFDGFPISDI